MADGPLHPSRLVRRWSEAPPAPLAVEVEALRRAGKPPLDLIGANPHEYGLRFPPAILSAIVEEAGRKIGVYRPDPLGLLAAREAVAGYYARRGAVADPARIVLTPGTSMGYFYALRLLADPGDEILIPSPGYPLFDDLCAVAGVGIRRYHLKCDDGRWRIDLDEIVYQLAPRTRAIMIVSPHNPTGAMVSAEEYEALGALCRERGIALVVDEVFCECLAPGAGQYARPIASQFPLVVALNGFSKMLSLPGWKLAWMKIDGDPQRTGALMRAVEHLSDTFLPVLDLQQAMVAPLFKAGEDGVIADLGAIYDRRRAAAIEALAAAGFDADRCEAGVYLCVRMQRREKAESIFPGADEAFALEALRRAGVLVHPGSYYELPEHWAMTCVAEESVLREGIARLAAIDGSKRP